MYDYQILEGKLGPLDINHFDICVNYDITGCTGSYVCTFLIIHNVNTIGVFLNALSLWQFGRGLYVMVKRLSNRLIGEGSGDFRCLCLMYWLVNAFVQCERFRL